MLLPIIVLACGPEPTTPVSERVVASVEVVPGDQTVETHADGGDPVQFRAVVSYEGGDQRETTGGVDWSSSNETAGTIDADGLFVPSADNGGVTWITAALDGHQDQATVTVRFQESWTEGDADPSLFDGVAEASTADDLWTYPEDGVNLPRNTPGITYQWTAPDLGGDTGGDDTGSAGGVHTWRLRFSSELTDVTVYTTGAAWTVDEDTWATIAATNAGGSIDVGLAGVTLDGVAVKAPDLRVEVNRFDARGAIVYWSTSASGFLRIPYGEPAEDYLTYEQTGQCMGCHAISRDGLIAFTYDGGNGAMGVKRTDDRSDVVAHDAGATGNFKAWSPDATRLLSTYQGVLTLWDTASWTSLGTVALDGTATHVDWSPDGTLIAVTLTDSHSQDWIIGGGRIAVLEVLGDDRFGAPTTVYAPPDGWQAYYPAFSPDGDWIAFNLSTGDSYDDADAELWVVPSDGGTAVALERANQTPGLTNSWPRWGPLPDDDILWLAFSSRRLYGDITTGNPQIWVTAFDPDVAAVGGDPSWPAFWLPNQDVEQGNHIPVWTE